MAYKEKANAIKYNNEFIKQTYDRINLTVPKGRKAELQAVAERHGQSVNGFINSLIDEALARETAAGSQSPENVPTQVQPPESEPRIGTPEWWAQRKSKPQEPRPGGYMDVVRRVQSGEIDRDTVRPAVEERKDSSVSPGGGGVIDSMGVVSISDSQHEFNSPQSCPFPHTGVLSPDIDLDEGDGDFPF